MTMKTLRLLFFIAVCLNLNSCDHHNDAPKSSGVEDKGDFLTLEDKLKAETPAGSRPDYTPEQIKQIQQEKTDLGKKNFMKGTVMGNPWKNEDYLNAVRFSSTLAIEGNNDQNTRISIALINCWEPGEYFFGKGQLNTIKVAFVYKEFTAESLDNPGSIVFEKCQANYVSGKLNTKLTDGKETIELKDFEFAVFF